MRSSLRHHEDSFEGAPLRATGERGYPLIPWNLTSALATSLLTAFLIIGASGILFVWYTRTGGDPFPDSTVGLGYAVVGTLFLGFALLLYTLRRRSRKRGIGELNAALQWHIAFAITGLVLLFLHSFGHFNPRSGTFALYALIALVISGFTGKLFDAILPRLITREVQKALTSQGDDRISTISRKLQDIVVHNTQEVHSFRASSNAQTESRYNPQSQPLLTSWDMAYISLEETPQELSRTETHYRFVPDKKSSLVQPGALIPGAQAHIDDLKSAQGALRREQLYRYLIRYWRILHVGLALLTVGLTLWHLEYAATLLIPVWLHR
jgi:hypothetical protein